MSEVPSLLYSDVEDELRQAVRDLLDDHSSRSDVLARTEQPPEAGTALWSRLAVDLGCAGLPVPETAGGAGGSWSEVAVVLEELGRAAADVPYFTSGVVATSLVAALGPGELLSALASGTVAAVAVPFAEPLGAQREEALSWSGTTLSGRVPLVAGALLADSLLVPVAGALLLVEAAAAELRAVPSLDMTRPLADLVFDASPATVLAEGHAADAALRHAQDVGAALLASEQLGLSERCLEMAVSHLLERRQFGRLLGSYQALKHRLADVWTELSRARAVARYAAVCAATEADDLPVAASLAQAVCGPVAQKAAEECVQLLGGVGFTWEHPAHLYLKRARTDALALGGAHWHRSRIGDLVDLPRQPTPDRGGR